MAKESHRICRTDNSQVTGYARPIVTDHNFGWGQLGNSLLTAGTTPAGIFTTIYVSRLPRPVEKGGKNRKDRNCICFAQCFIGPGKPQPRDHRSHLGCVSQRFQRRSCGQDCSA